MEIISIPNQVLLNPKKSKVLFPHAKPIFVEMYVEYDKFCVNNNDSFVVSQTNTFCLTITRNR